MKKKREKFVVSLRRAMGVVLPICMLSFLFVCVICYVANDVYAFDKKESEIRVFIETPYKLEDIAKKLGDERIVNEPFVFMLYVRSKGKEELLESFTGNATLNSSMSYREIVNTFVG